MQRLGEASEAVATTFGWIGADFLTVFQVLFFLVLGYVSLRVVYVVGPWGSRRIAG